MTNRIDFDELEWTEDQCAVTSDGPYTGEVFERDSSGKVVALITYRDGFKDGKETHYHPDGSLAFEGIWKWGAGGVGVHRSWYSNGQVKQVTYYNNDGYVERIDRFAENGAQIMR